MLTRKQHSPVLGFAFDGFPLYGPYESDGVMAKDLKKSAALDVCNGHIDEIRGYHYHVQFELDPNQAVERRLPDGSPTWVQIGPFEAKKITRDGNLVTAEIQVMDDSPLGVLFDCHIEFDSNGGRGGPIVFKKNDVFRVVE